MGSGSEARNVLFLHGFLGSSEDWRESAEAIAEPGFRCIAPDLPGHGGSVGLTPGVYTMSGASDAVIEALDEAGAEECHIVGYSMGGRLALYLALRQPKRVASVLLESSSPGLKTDEERAVRRRSDEALARRLEAVDSEGFRTFLEEWHRQPLFASLAGYDGLIEGLVKEREKNDPEELARSLRGMGTGSQPSLWEELPTLSVPTLAVAGELDEKFVGIAQEMSASSRNIESVAVRGAGHNLHVEKPRESARLLRRDLSRRKSRE